MKSLIVIPARYASTRLPGKPLLAETGKPLIQHAWERACQSKAEAVIVATDDERIMDAVQGFGGEAVMTSPDHTSGTTRVAEAAEARGADVIINMQGDEPEVDPAHLDLLIDLQASTDAFASTLVCPFSGPADGPGSPCDPACVKAVLGPKVAEDAYRVLYFSRALVPWPRDAGGVVQDPGTYFLHVGLYGFSADSLAAFSRLPSSSLEAQEHLEQLRILEAGHQMVAAVVDGAMPGIDTPEDYAAFVARVAAIRA